MYLHRIIEAFLFIFIGFLGNSSFSLYLLLVFVKIDSKLHLISRKPYKSDFERHYLKS